ncbi:flagellar basal body P-ring formation chaperone FlgA [Niveispirillum fermenti]|uniref:flagellar basal body P-ring formation chaperone FlgA n=1 Tax=Niveispirillum fermenti TaxID=1233113 RepID=UPI003A839BEF
MRHLLSPLALALLLAVGPAVPARADADADALLRAAIHNRYGSALGQGELRLRIVTAIAGGMEKVEALNVDPGSRRFAAILSGPHQRQRVEGEIWTEIEIPVPNRRMAPGEIITDGDLTLIPVRTDQVGQRTITDRAGLIGMEARRVLSPGRPVPASSIAAQPVVQRNRPVTLEYRQGALLITARGRALADGALGEMIRVQNLDSNRTLAATVTGPDTVSAAE